MKGSFSTLPNSQTIRKRSLIIVIIGPTGSGKTALAHKIAKKIRGDIITCDSRQIFQEMYIGTAKPHKITISKQRPEIRCPDVKGVRHYGIDLVRPNQYFSAQQWLKMAEESIQKIQRRGRIPIIEGGTWQWIYALLFGYTIPEVPPNKTLRARLAKRSSTQLTREVLRKDPAAAHFIDIHNPRRLIRALEVMHAIKRPFSELRGTKKPAYNFIVVGIDSGVQKLKIRLTRRLTQKLRQGLKREVNALQKRYGWKAPGMSGIGYREWRDPNPQKEIISQIISDTNKLARVQRKMFGKIKNVRWIKRPTDLTDVFLRIGRVKK